MKTIAIIGASADRNKFGNKAVRAYTDLGYKVYPVHPKEKTIEGHKAYATLGEVPEKHLNMVSFYLTPEVGMKVLPQLKAKQIDELWLNPGSESDELIGAAEAQGLNVIPACSIVAGGKRPSDY